jgi:hypothetical protein
MKVTCALTITAREGRWRRRKARGALPGRASCSAHTEASPTLRLPEIDSVRCAKDVVGLSGGLRVFRRQRDSRYIVENARPALCPHLRRCRARA